jgi:hypothetical protein
VGHKSDSWRLKRRIQKEINDRITSKIISALDITGKWVGQVMPVSVVVSAIK